jgi:hypothetical protein
MIQIPLEESFLCADCNTICNSAIQCPCGSQHGLLSLATVLNRTQRIPEIKREVQELLNAMDEVCA